MTATASKVTSPQIMAALMRMLRREIGESLRPELSSAYAIYVADLMQLILDHMEDWVSETGYPGIEARRAVLGEGASGPALLPDFDDRSGLDSMLEARVKALAQAGDEVQLQEVSAAIGALFDDLYSTQNERHSRSREHEKALLARIDVELTAERVEHFAAERMAIRDDPVTGIAKIPGGNSKDTFLATFASGREWVIRRDFPAGPTEGSAPDDLGLLRRLEEIGYPAPRAIAAERDPTWFGQPVLIMARVPGEDAIVPARADPAAGGDVARELARHLAMLHTLDPVELGFPPSAASAREQVRAYLAQWREWWGRNRIHPFSLLEAGFDWLDNNIPAYIPRIVTVHGDPRPDNMMMQDGRVTAVLDWEFAHPGDPNEDLQYAKGFVAPFLPWEDFLDAYREAGGAPVSEEGARFYDVFRSVRNLVCIDASWKGFVTDAYPSFKLASQGVVYKRMLAHELARSLRDIKR